MKNFKDQILDSNYLNISVRQTYLYNISHTYRLNDFNPSNLNDCIEALHKCFNQDLNNTVVIKIKDNEILNYKELIYFYKNLDKFYFDQYTGNVSYEKTNENYYSIKSLGKTFESIFYTQQKEYRIKTNFDVKEKELNKDFYKNRDKINKLDAELTKESNKDLILMKWFIKKLYDLSAVIIEYREINHEIETQ
jgi:hypothetical protein